jgi:glycosyltransferase involved in cell wall biosynthesis
MRGVRIAVLVPCRNEAATVAQVVCAFRAALPGCVVYVYDNASTDATGQVARNAGAVVRREMRPGKGGVVRRMFAEIDAEAYVIVDGDATYDASRAPELIAALLEDDLDMVTATRDADGEPGAYRSGHRFGNWVFNSMLGIMFGQRPTDMFSGYRAFSRRFVKSFPLSAQGFEIETELTVHALDMRVPTAEIATRYRARAEGSASKLNKWRDGWRILLTVATLFRDVRPLPFFGILAALLLAAGLALGSEVVVEYMRTGLVPRLPTAVLATGLVLLASLSLVCGIILDSVARGRRETKRLAYLAAGAARTTSLEAAR